MPFERHFFRQIAQVGDETVDQFVCRLRQRAASCNFGVLEDDYIRDQVIDKCYSSHLRRKFLKQEGSLTLDCPLKIARAQEAVNRQVKEMEQNLNQSHMNAVGGRSSGGAWKETRGTRTVRGTRVARKEARSQRFVMVSDGKDTSQKIGAAQHMVRPVRSVER